MKSFLLSLGLAFMGVPTVSLAQEPEPVPCLMLEPRVPTPWWRRVDEPIEVLPDGSFSKTSEDDPYAVGIRGGPVVDVGGGIVAQKLMYPYIGCGPGESLLVVDCRSSEAVIFDGLPDPLFTTEGHHSYTSIRLLQPPEGLIALRPGVRIDDLVAIAVASGIDADLDVAAQVNRLSPRNRWDPFFGCAKFYSDYSGRMDPS